MTPSPPAEAGLAPPPSPAPPQNGGPAGRASRWRRLAAGCRRHAPAAAAFAALALLVALSCLDRGTVTELAAKRTWLDAERLGRTARTLVRAATVCALAAAAALVLAPRLRRRPAAAFLLLAVLIGPLYPFALTPFSIPDETFHYQQVLARAAPLAGIEECDESFALAPLGRFLHRNRPEGYVFLGGGGTGAPPSAETVPAGTVRPAEWTRKGNLLLYLPQTAGVAVGLRTGLGPRETFYLGRLAALAFYVLCVFFAIRLAPAFRRSLAVVALCPIALQQAASFSYDCAALSAGFLCFGLFLRLGSDDRPLRPAAACAALAAVAVGMAVKGAAAAFLPLLAAMPAIRFPRRRLGKAVFLALAVVVAAAALAAAASVLPGVVRDRAPGMLGNGRPAHTVASVLEAPWETGKVFLRTFDFDAVPLFFDAVGSRMSGLSLKLPPHVTLAFLLAVFLSFRGDRRIPRSAAFRWASAAGIVILTLYLCFVMLFTETPDYAGNIWDLQGRYWTPVLPLLACLLFARNPSPAPDSAPTGLVFPALALLHLDSIVFTVKTTLSG